MSEIKLAFKKPAPDGPPSACCAQPSVDISGPRLPQPWLAGFVNSPAGPVPRISTVLDRGDQWGRFKCRVSSYRDDYTVPPGLYAAGDPDGGSEVVASANYKFSFDMLRRQLKGINAWVLVLDTKGINVWCAAGKGSFSTGELINRITSANLKELVGHRRIVLPQLGAPGVSAHEVKRATGFRVHYGPVRASDLPDYLGAGLAATKKMRTVGFTFMDRLVLTPMEIIPMMKKYPLYALFILAAFGLEPSGILFRDAFRGGFPFLLLGLVPVLSGAFLTPLLLPYIPFRSFAVKGWIMGAASLYLSMRFIPWRSAARTNGLLLAACWLFFPMASSYIALQFTGSTPFTGMSGVKKELKTAIPVYLASVLISAALLVLYKLALWRFLI
ncbi:MAG: mercury methylation corrinoid protein HgcA [Nitrospiraceae bacterium]|nr:mercury methylation corrinoid protein HgcA [Nitrospiraceae bacterium]